jgi:hypothetical protein
MGSTLFGLKLSTYLDKNPGDDYLLAESMLFSNGEDQNIIKRGCSYV